MDDPIIFEIEPFCIQARIDETGCRGFIAAIIYQAYVDKAVNFFDPKNSAFKFYCMLLDYDPAWVANNMKNAINRKLREERKKHCC